MAGFTSSSENVTHVHISWYLATSLGLTSYVRWLFCSYLKSKFFKAKFPDYPDYGIKVFGAYSVVGPRPLKAETEAKKADTETKKAASPEIRFPQTQNLIPQLVTGSAISTSSSETISANPSPYVSPFPYSTAPTSSSTSSTASPSPHASPFTSPHASTPTSSSNSPTTSLRNSSNSIGNDSLKGSTGAKRPRLDPEMRQSAKNLTKSGPAYREHGVVLKCNLKLPLLTDTGLRYVVTFSDVKAVITKKDSSKPSRHLHVTAPALPPQKAIVKIRLLWDSPTEGTVTLSELTTSHEYKEKTGNEDHKTFYEWVLKQKETKEPEYPLHEGKEKTWQQVLDHVKKNSGTSSGQNDALTGVGALAFVLATYGITSILSEIIQERPRLLTRKHPVSGHTLLHSAVESFSPACVEMLLKSGSRVDLATAKGKQPLHFAAKAGHKEIIKLLVDNGADVTARTKKGKTPSDYGKVITDEVKVHSNSNNKNNAEVPKPKENLKNCEPFSFAELARLIDTSEQWDDTVLLCGRTGAGKSTTINFLAGCLSSPKLGENLRAKSSSDNSDAYDDWYASVNGTRPIGKSLNVLPMGITGAGKSSSLNAIGDLLRPRTSTTWSTVLFAGGTGVGKTETVHFHGTSTSSATRITAFDSSFMFVDTPGFADTQALSVTSHDIAKQIAELKMEFDTWVAQRCVMLDLMLEWPAIDCTFARHLAELNNNLDTWNTCLISMGRSAKLGQSLSNLVEQIEELRKAFKTWRAQHNDFLRTGKKSEKLSFVAVTHEEPEITSADIPFMNRFEKHMVAIKYPKDWEKLKERTQSSNSQTEKSLTNGLRHSNIVNAFGYSPSDHLSLEQTTLRDFEPFSGTRLIHSFLDIYAGVNYLHTMNTMHRDLSLENFISAAGAFTAKIADFGESRSVADGNRLGALEETQVRGRAERQGEKGSFPMFLVPETVEQRNKDDCWNDLLSRVESALSFSEAFLKSDTREEENAKKRRSSCTLFSLDNTGSMSTLLQSVKTTVSALAERLYSAIPDQEKIRITAYRDYNSPPRAPRAPLVDEVDVFLNTNFYGQQYRPSSPLSAPKKISGFQTLGVEAPIEYGTLAELCEKFINTSSNVRDSVREMMERNTTSFESHAGSVWLVDAPGFSDTAGAKVDITNAVGVLNALRGCKSVKILALLGWNSTDDRQQGIVSLAELLSGSKASGGSAKKGVLLIDEVDVFFSKDFYGQHHRPSSFFPGPEIIAPFISDRNPLTGGVVSFNDRPWADFLTRMRPTPDLSGGSFEVSLYHTSGAYVSSFSTNPEDSSGTLYLECSSNPLVELFIVCFKDRSWADALTRILPTLDLSGGSFTTTGDFNGTLDPLCPSDPLVEPFTVYFNEQSWADFLTRILPTLELIGSLKVSLHHSSGASNLFTTPEDFPRNRDLSE